MSTKHTPEGLTSLETITLKLLRDILAKHDNEYDGEPMDIEAYDHLERLRSLLARLEKQATPSALEESLEPEHTCDETPVDVDICSACGEHASFCSACGSDCCGAHSYDTDYDPIDR